MTSLRRRMAEDMQVRSICASEPGPPSPEYPWEPVPASVEITPDGSILRIRWSEPCETRGDARGSHWLSGLGMR